jgi:hypothetical protein
VAIIEEALALLGRLDLETQVRTQQLTIAITKAQGGIIAVFIFLKKDAPKYTTGYSICLAFALLSLIAESAYTALCARQNKKRQMVAQSLLTESETAELGDLSPNYRYML